MVTAPPVTVEPKFGLRPLCRIGGTACGNTPDARANARGEHPMLARPRPPARHAKRADQRQLDPKLRRLHASPSSFGAGGGSASNAAPLTSSRRAWEWGAPHRAAWPLRYRGAATQVLPAAHRGGERASLERAGAHRCSPPVVLHRRASRSCRQRRRRCHRPKRRATGVQCRERTLLAGPSHPPTVTTSQVQG